MTFALPFCFIFHNKHIVFIQQKPISVENHTFYWWHYGSCGRKLPQFNLKQAVLFDLEMMAMGSLEESYSVQSIKFILILSFILFIPL